MKTILDEDFLAFVGEQESQFFASPAEYANDVARIFEPPAGESMGDLLPWSKTHAFVALRPGEVSVWAGINGHGKSQLLGQVMAWVLPYSRIAIASLEMPPARTIARMMRQCSGQAVPSAQWREKWMQYTDDKLWIYDQTDSVESERILGMVHYAASVLKCKHIVIDSLMKCGLSGRQDEVMGKQKEFVDRLCWAAKSRNVHIHLVHHMRKGESEFKVPDKFDVKGAGEIVDMVDCLFVAHRNKAKERRIEMGEDYDVGEPDQIIDVAKQRHGEWEGRINLYFHPKSLQYLPQPERGAMPWPGEIE